jgi:hypothetical protein
MHMNLNLNLSKPGLLLLTALLLACSKPVDQPGGPLQLEIDPASPGEVFEGIGAVSAGASSRLLIDYPEPWRSQILDFLFKPGYGASLQHLKVEIGGDINSTDGTEPSHMRERGQENFHRGYEWWLMKEAVARNPEIVLSGLAWGAPGWIGDGKYFTRDGAEYLLSFVRGAREAHGLEIQYLGILNEREYDTEWIKLLRQVLDEGGYGHVKIVAADLNGPPERIWSIARDMEANPELAEVIDVIGVHYPHGEMPQVALDFQKQGKRLWSSEDGEWYWATMRPIPHLRAQKINRNYIDYRFTKTGFWSLITSYFDCLPAPNSGLIQANTPWSGHYHILPTLWMVAHTTQFVQPGWHYLDPACRHLPGGGTAVALVSPDGQQLSVVVETAEAGSEQELELSFPGVLKPEQLHLWHSDGLEQFIQDPPITAEGGVIRMKLAPNTTYTLTTTTGQRKGGAVSPPQGPFPLPYRDDFEAYTTGATPKYLCDQGGAFEVSANPGGGMWLRQQILRQGIDWSEASFAYTLTGDEQWNDMEVSADAHFPEGGTGADVTPFALVTARCYPGNTWVAFGHEQPIGYALILYADGQWKLSTLRRTLASGTVPPPGIGRHNLMLRCQGQRITALLDDRVLAEIDDATYRNGLAGIGSSFHPVAFDNFSVR